VGVGREVLVLVGVGVGMGVSVLVGMGVEVWVGVKVGVGVGANRLHETVPMSKAMASMASRKYPGFFISSSSMETGLAYSQVAIKKPPTSRQRLRRLSLQQRALYDIEIRHLRMQEWCDCIYHAPPQTICQVKNISVD
jgi:hypothetical protein